MHAEQLQKQIKTKSLALIAIANNSEYDEIFNQIFLEIEYLKKQLEAFEV